MSLCRNAELACEVTLQPLRRYPFIPAYDVNAQGSGDMYPKGGNMLHSIRHSMDDDKLFKNVLTGLNMTFHNKTVDGSEILEYISEKSGYDYSKVFEQYLTTTKIPKLQLYIDAPNSKMFYRYTNTVDGFNLPLVLKGDEEKIKIIPSSEWQSVAILHKNLFDAAQDSGEFTTLVAALEATGLDETLDDLTNSFRVSARA